MAIVNHGVTSLHEHGAELEDLLSEGAGTVLLRGNRVREGEGVESHMVYIRRVYLDLRFFMASPVKARKKVLFLKKYI